MSAQTAAKPTLDTGTKPSRYLFDEVFALDSDHTPQPANTVGLAEHEAALAQAREQGRTAGIAEGRTLAEDEQAKRLSSALERLSGGLAGLGERAAADRAAIEQAAVRLAHHAAAKLAEELIAREPEAELTALLSTCLAEIRAVPHLAIRVAEDQVEDMRRHAGEAARLAGFAGKVIVIGEPQISAGDGRIEWADGGVVRDVAEIKQAIDAAVEGYLASPDTVSPDAASPQSGNQSDE